tara:strand:+ start:215 stop:418 length:204 start_codon:yes stop_codon:yes gene_type:complete
MLKFSKESIKKFLPKVSYPFLAEIFKIMMLFWSILVIKNPLLQPKNRVFLYENRLNLISYLRNQKQL